MKNSRKFSLANRIKTYLMFSTYKEVTQITNLKKSSRKMDAGDENRQSAEGPAAAGQATVPSVTGELKVSRVPGIP